MEIRFSVEQVVMQPTQLCNLNCSYCYLPDRDKNRKMIFAVAERVATGICDIGNDIEVVWHGGEPMICGIEYFSSLVAPFEEARKQGRIHHAIQTNATVIDTRWCRFFKSHQFRVGISLDGPLWANVKRVDWNNKPAFKKTLCGIRLLKEAGVAFSVICVVSGEVLKRASELYEFFVELGCTSLGINVEEHLGVYNLTINQRSNDAAVTKFWQDLFSVWLANPAIKIREFDRILPSLANLNDAEPASLPEIYDIFPSIAWNGDVVLLAPEFLNTAAPRYNDFVVGNVLTEDLHSIVERGKTALYVRDYINGVNRCLDSCKYFSVCFGGQAGNKFFEHGTTDATKTAFCRNSEMRLADSILQVLENQT